MTILFFGLSGLDLLKDAVKEKEKVINFIYALQIAPNASGIYF